MADADQSVESRKPSRAKKKGEGLNFEESLKKLEEIVRRLEEEQVPLDESLRLFSEGKKLARACEVELQTAENKVRQLIEEKDQIREVPFEALPGTSDDVAEDEGPETPPASLSIRDDIPF